MKDLNSYIKQNYSSKKLNSFNEGGTHESSRLGGIPQGKGKTVEEGESSFKFKNGKFIFSNRINLNGKIDKLSNIGLSKGGPQCGGPGQPPCKSIQPTENEIQKINKFTNKTLKKRNLDPNKTANTVSNMFGNFNKYMFNKEDVDLIESPYKPTKGSSRDKYYTRDGIREDIYRDLNSDKVKKDYNHSGEFDDIFKGLDSNGKDRKHNAENSFPKNKAGYKGMYNLGHGSLKGQFNLGRYKVDAGKDERGRYISFSDTYDWNGFKTENAIPFYDRIYEDEWGNYEKEKKRKIKQESPLLRYYNKNL